MLRGFRFIADANLAINSVGSIRLGPQNLLSFYAGAWWTTLIAAPGSYVFLWRSKGSHLVFWTFAFQLPPVVVVGVLCGKAVSLMLDYNRYDIVFGTAAADGTVRTISWAYYRNYGVMFDLADYTDGFFALEVLVVVVERAALCLKT